jgi:hypothetical protein
MQRLRVLGHHCGIGVRWVGLSAHMEGSAVDRRHVGVALARGNTHGNVRRVLAASPSGVAELVVAPDRQTNGQPLQRRPKFHVSRPQAICSQSVWDVPARVLTSLAHMVPRVQSIATTDLTVVSGEV